MFQSEISKEQVAELDLIQFEGPIHVIDSREAFKRAVPFIAREQILGIDTETRPSFKKGTLYPTSLIQLSTLEQAWILRVSRIGYPKELLKLLSKDVPLKVGVSLHDDLRRLRSDFRFEPKGFLDLQQYVEAFRIEEKGLKKLSGIVLESAFPNRSKSPTGTPIF